MAVPAGGAEEPPKTEKVLGTDAVQELPGEVHQERCPRPYLEIDTEDLQADDAKTPKPYLEIDTQTGSEVSPRLSDRKISLDVTPLSCKSADSSAEYFQPNQTIIIFDWDDTLCPSTTCMRTHGLSVLGDPPTGEVAHALEELAEEVALLLEQATNLAEKVVVVTNAEEGWVDLSCKAWLPSLYPLLARCEVASARSTWEPQGVVSPAGWKARTFGEVIDKFYSRYDHQTWKNVISVGDAPHEREALSRVVRQTQLDRARHCRSKSVKFVLRPTIDQLIRELQMLRESLKVIVWHDDDLDLHFSAESLADPLIPSPTSEASSAV
eukprot:TRINITY_DN55167_c0_g1_i1.p1 TRINITY_DN55167_c0_g1~~TRINITY_DN55167_c0_g1_i1.p1  ORF type:complete len:352 (+),score=62.14 TRINITY_DN55167_c0_g1_i1:85-1056(+)